MDRSAPPKAKSIAIVDDDEAILDSLRLLLEVHEWNVRTYSTGEAFLTDLDYHVPDCLILDPHLPGVSAATVARAVSNGAQHIPVIGLTARPDSPLAIEVATISARVMLTKPVKADTILDHLQTALGGA